jgi:hypothetical protein
LESGVYDSARTPQRLVEQIVQQGPSTSADLSPGKIAALASGRQASMRNASSTKRFMAPSGGPVNVPPSSSQQPAMNPTSNFSQSASLSNTRVSPSYGRQHPQMQQSAPPSRYLVTVLPPEQLPHDPPHPRTSTFCSGYGPPSKFR